MTAVPIGLNGEKLSATYFPNLERFANKILRSPPSSVESEPLFSIGGNITHQTAPQTNNTGDWREIDASELQSADLYSQLQETI